MKTLTKDQRVMVASYLLDRADQYETESPCWISLSDAARAVARGEVEDAVRHGELLEPDLLARVRRMAASAEAAPKVNPRLGVEP